MSIENVIEICVAIDIAILGIAYPIIVDKISNIGDKYQSQYIPVLFNNEFPQKSLKFVYNEKEYKVTIFKLLLVFTLVSFLFIIFKTEPLWGWDNWLINNSANLMVITFSLVLTVLFFLWLDKVILFNGKSSSLLIHIVKKYDALSADNEIMQYYLKAINELTYYAVEKQDEHLQETLLEFYYKIFANIRRSHTKNLPLEYPVDLYFMVNKLNEESTVVQNRKLRAIEHRAVSGIWLLGEDFEEIIISEETYNWLWRNIYTICDYPRLVKMFWANSSQYYNFRLQPIHQDYDFEAREIINKVEVERREKERKRFIEFHYALGGLVYYRKNYDLLKYFFEYSQSQPPKYVLLPESMTEIFYWFEHFRNEFKNIGTPIDLKYYFPELDNLGNRRQVNYWICSYLTILFNTIAKLISDGKAELSDIAILTTSWRDAYFISKSLRQKYHVVGLGSLPHKNMNTSSFGLIRSLSKFLFSPSIINLRIIKRNFDSHSLENNIVFTEKELTYKINSLITSFKELELTANLTKGLSSVKHIFDTIFSVNNSDIEEIINSINNIDKSQL